MQVEEYIAKLKYICSEPDNEKRDEVSKQLLADISSTEFLATLQAVFSTNIIDSGIKLVTASLLKQFVKDNVKKMTFEDSCKIVDLVFKLACSDTTTVDAKDELAISLKFLIIRANSRLSL